ncbi:MAG: helix-turn-helix transcriptional regulator [Myxococcales bacterium]|nr:helix-turn-helix transcriptional regulator [Myxococcales bacterium]
MTQQVRSIRIERTLAIDLDEPPDHHDRRLVPDLRRLAAMLDHEVPPTAEAAELVRAVWRGLVDGGWALLDSFEQDDRWFVVARKRATADPRAALTARERQVLALAVQGHSNKVAAFELGLTTSTIATYLRRAMTKLNLASRAELVQALPIAALGEGR